MAETWAVVSRQHHDQRRLLVGGQAVGLEGTHAVEVVDHPFAGDDGAQGRDDLTPPVERRPVRLGHPQAQTVTLAGDHPREDVLLQKHQPAKDQSQDDAVLEGAGQDLALAALQVGDGGAGGDVLRRDHLAHHPARRVGGGDQHRVEAELVGGDHLQVAEQSIARGVAARQEDGQPAQEGREQREQDAGRRDAHARACRSGPNSSSLPAQIRFRSALVEIAPDGEGEEPLKAGGAWAAHRLLEVLGPPAAGVIDWADVPSSRALARRHLPDAASGEPPVRLVFGVLQGCRISPDETAATPESQKRRQTPNIR